MAGSIGERRIRRGAGLVAAGMVMAAMPWAMPVAETTTTSVPVVLNSLFQKSATTGVCSAATHPAGFIVPLTSAQAPKVSNGGLRVVR